MWGRNPHSAAECSSIRHILRKLSGHSRKQVGRRAFYITALGSLVIDQLSKAVVRHLIGLGDSIEVIPGFFNITLSRNYGMAFGTMSSWAPLIILISLASIYAIVKLRHAREKAAVIALSLGLLLGGAAGNLIDRLAFGYVTDFLDFYIARDTSALSWPTFNVADIALVAGVLLLFYYVFVIEKRAAN